ncbi:envelope stress response membrane protein PspC [Candidatus Sumerlaeota bacterium]|nr:envelope stress response membrane protein PspC [Candidatus Sumerlaeota bacterium]
MSRHHLRHNWYERRKRNGLYRSRKGVIFGVCAGIAKHLDLSVTVVRLIVVGACILTGFWPMIVIYIVAALLMKPEPVLPLSNDDEREFYNSYTASHEMALHRLKQTFDRLDRRIQRMEDIVTKRNFNWDQKLNR